MGVDETMRGPRALQGSRDQTTPHRVVAEIRKRYADSGTHDAVRGQDARRQPEPSSGRASPRRPSSSCDREGLDALGSFDIVRAGEAYLDGHLDTEGDLAQLLAAARHPHRPAPGAVRRQVRPPAAARAGPQRPRLHRAPLRERPGLLPVLPRPPAPRLLPGRLRAPGRAARGRHHPQARLRARRDRRGPGSTRARHRRRLGRLRRVRRPPRVCTSPR